MANTDFDLAVAADTAVLVASLMGEYGVFSWAWFETGDTEPYFAMFPWPPPSPADLLIAGEDCWREQEADEWTSRGPA